MGIGKTGIPWDSHGNGNTISRGMAIGIRPMGMGLGIRTWEWEKSSDCNLFLCIVCMRCKISHAAILLGYHILSG